MATRNTEVEGTELKRIREAANLTRDELVTKLGNGGYHERNIKAIEKGLRVVGVNVVSDWATACGYTLQLRFDRDPTIPQQPSPNPKPKGWFMSHRANRFHFDPGTGKSLCGKLSSDNQTNFLDRQAAPHTCRKCQYHLDNQ